MKEPGTEAGLDAAWELGLGFGEMPPCSLCAGAGETTGEMALISSKTLAAAGPTVCKAD